MSEKTVHSMQLFLNEFEYDSIHGAFNDRFDLFAFKIQKAILNYADDLFVLNKFENNKIPLAFDWIKFTVWCSVNSVFQNNKTLNDIKIDINENTNQDFTPEIQQLKEIYDKFKKGGINGNDN